ncbi:MAG: 16S rRNA (uracil(1498)-N(3))-methyltransferase [Chthonomonadales bacterium]
MQYRHHFLSPELLKSELITLKSASAHHLLNVLRVKVGENIILLNGLGEGWVAEVESTQGKELVLRRVDRAVLPPEPDLKITVAQAIGKGDKLEEVIQHGTEIGASRFIPLLTERTIVRLDQKAAEDKRTRWQAISVNAAEQSHRSIPPEVALPAKFRESIQSQAGMKLLLDPTGEPLLGFKTELVRSWSAGVALYVGPEGGWSSPEIEIAREHGAKIVSVGEYVLRTETAALAAAAQAFALYRLCE